MLTDGQTDGEVINVVAPLTKVSGAKKKHRKLGQTRLDLDQWFTGQAFPNPLTIP